MQVQTRLAIQAYCDVLRAERRLERLEAKLNKLVILIPPDDLAAYIAATDEADRTHMTLAELRLEMRGVDRT